MVDKSGSLMMVVITLDSSDIELLALAGLAGAGHWLSHWLRGRTSGSHCGSPTAAQ